MKVECRELVLVKVSCDIRDGTQIQDTRNLSDWKMANKIFAEKHLKSSCINQIHVKSELYTKENADLIIQWVEDYEANK